MNWNATVSKAIVSGLFNMAGLGISRGLAGDVEPLTKFDIKKIWEYTKKVDLSDNASWIFTTNCGAADTVANVYIEQAFYNNTPANNSTTSGGGGGFGTWSMMYV